MLSIWLCTFNLFLSLLNIWTYHIYRGFFITMVLVKFSGMLCHVSWYIVTIQHVITSLKACIFSIAPVIPSNLIWHLCFIFRWHHMNINLGFLCLLLANFLEASIRVSAYLWVKLSTENKIGCCCMWSIVFFLSLIFLVNKLINVRCFRKDFAFFS
jgi:hypothetical protein